MEEQAMGTITLVSPEAPAPAAAATAEQRAVNRKALRFGILDNSKGNADHLLRLVVEGVKKAMPLATVVSLRKNSVSLPAPAEILDQLTRETDFVISAMAD
jgi:hypothetical protein